MTAFPELFLTWGKDEDDNPREYRCRVTFDVTTHIEQKVSLWKMAHAILRDPEAIPVSHVTWIMYCLLHGAGAPVTPELVWQEMRANALRGDDMTAVCQYVLSEIFGTGPETAPKKETAGKGRNKKKSPSRRRST